MKVSDFHYELPPGLIAQHPAERRDMSRLLVLDRQSGALSHMRFCDLPSLLRAGDVLVINDSRVLPARLIGEGARGGRMEMLLLRRVDADGLRWEVMVKPGRRAKVGSEFTFGGGILRARVDALADDGLRIVEFSCDGEFEDVLSRVGVMPLPPYITETLEDAERYQTVYSRELGSAAAPTAGLHFSPELLARIEQCGVHIARVTLHVGLGTFRPVKAENVADHHMHSERYHIDQAAADTVNAAKADGRRIIAVGTTSCRVLESACDGGRVKAGAGETDIFIYPGYKFRMTGALVTNFHLPESTLLMLVSALVGRERILAAYAEAIECRYRFFSFGDAMFII